MKRLAAAILTTVFILGATAMSKEAFDITKIDRYMDQKQADENGLRWHDAAEKPFIVSGLNWFNQDKKYVRIPDEKLQGLPPSLHSLSKCTTGAQLRFRSNTSRITVAVSVPLCKQSALQPPAGQSGFDLYVDGIYWTSVQKADISQPYTYQVFKSEGGTMREFVLNFPLYNGVNWLRIGLDEKALVEAPSPRAISGPVVIYGTSITQGGCASRPGMAFTNIISRRLNIDILNFGFSGNGKNEPEVAEILAGIENPAMYIIDSEANSVSPELIQERVPRFIEILRNKHPETPILVISKVKYGPRYAAECPVFKEHFKKIVEYRQSAGDKNIHFLDGSDFFGGEDEYFDCTTDSAHPNDLGFYRMAKEITPVVKRLLGL